MQLNSPQKWLRCLPETRAGSPRTDLMCSSHQLNFVTTTLLVTGLRCSPSQMALLPPQMPAAQAGVTPPSLCHPSVHTLQPETTNPSNEQQACLLRGLTLAQTTLFLPQFPLPRGPHPAALSNSLCFYSTWNIIEENSYSHF